MILILGAIVLAAGCVGSQSNSNTSPNVRDSFNYCDCGLHQSGNPQAETACYVFKNQCRDSDYDSNADPCIAYKQITDLYMPDTCNPDFSNAEAKTRYCALMMPGADLRANPWLAETCGAEVKAGVFTGRSAYTELIACVGNYSKEYLQEQGTMATTRDVTLQEIYDGLDAADDKETFCQSACQVRADSSEWPAFSSLAVSKFYMGCRCYDCGT